MNFITINPATEIKLASYTRMSSKSLEDAISNSAKAFAEYKKTPFRVRQNLMLKVVEILEEREQEFAELITAEVGKPITYAIAEVKKCALVAKHYADNAEKYLQPHKIKTDLNESYVIYQPLGVIFAIMPWNFPFWQVFRFAAPNLMAGNVGILKHAPNCFGCGEKIAQIFLDAGFPPNVFQHVVIDTEQASDVISNQLIAGVTLTGSEQAGRAVGSSAGRNLKKSVLELGGNDPYIVFADADLDLAAEQIVKSRLNNSGQVCISAKRIIVVKEIFEKLLEKITNIIGRYIVGDPAKTNTHCGPLARRDLREHVHNQVLESVKKGAHLVLGGQIPNGQGFYYPITLLTNVVPGMPAFDDEIFGPVLAITTVDNEDMAISYANQTRFGLSCVLFSNDIAKARRIIEEELQAGSCFINTMSASNPLLPFGGIKNSGYGRELSREGITEFVNVKTIGINI